LYPKVIYVYNEIPLFPLPRGKRKKRRGRGRERRREGEMYI
jgi:hypothetical protein